MPRLLLGTNYRIVPHTIYNYYQESDFSLHANTAFNKSQSNLFANKA